jgi:ribosomal protein L40E
MRLLARLPLYRGIDTQSAVCRSCWIPSVIGLFSGLRLSSRRRPPAESSWSRSPIVWPFSPDPCSLGRPFTGPTKPSLTATRTSETLNDMRRCNTCRQISPHDARFCGSCGASFGVRLCPKFHENPIEAQYCRTCGSRDLSRHHHIPQSARLQRTIVLSGCVVLGVLVLTAILLMIAGPRDLLSLGHFLSSLMGALLGSFQTGSLAPS